MRRRSRYGWLELIEGILLILLGIYTLFNPGNTIRGITVVYGILAVITGISDIVFYAKTEHYVGFAPTVALISGILSLLAGLMLLMYPNAGELIMTLLLPIWFIAHSVSRLTHLPLLLYYDRKYFWNHPGLFHDHLACHSSVFRRLHHRRLSDPSGNRQCGDGMQQYGCRVDVEAEYIYRLTQETTR